LNRIIHDTLALLEHQFKTARIRVVGELEPSLPQIHGNPGKLQQVFLNLFLNAKDAMPQGGTLTVRTAHDHGVRVHVIDTAAALLPSTSTGFTIRSSPPRRVPSRAAVAGRDWDWP